MQHVLVSDSAPTSSYVSTLDRSGDMHVAINDMAVIEELSVGVLQSHQSILREAELVVADTNLPVEALTWLAESLNKTPLFIDTVSAVKAPKIRSLLGSIHTLKANEPEAEALSGISARRQADRRRLADWFHVRGVERLFVTLGKRGVFYSTAGGQGLEKPTQAGESSGNTGGAGDAFLAGLALAWIEAQPLQESVRFALAAAGLTLSDDATSSIRMSRSAVERAMA